EIGEMPLDMQPHLLRVLQDGVVVRLGDTRERQVSVRLVAATNRDLQKEIAAGRFREDLYHRLCAVSLQLPALRDRPGDIESIVNHLNHKLARKYGCPPKRIEPSVYQTLVRYRWPGNIRELQNVFEVMFALGENNGIDVSMLSSLVESGPAGDATALAPIPISAASGRLDDLERQAILAAINDARGNLSRAARTLGISRSTLYVKLAAIRT
ncbi:MAG TPA: sigma-54-dependent Fis family transcriptional regulator, partial [Cupriavidus sp.]|nr:sigma-54-dependent Fis family transcriptional regulator [Cupriavidus sp.]